MYWFACIDNSDHFFELLQVALYSAKVNTSLTPIILCAGTSARKRAILDDMGILNFDIKLDSTICYATTCPGAICRLYIPLIAELLNIKQTILYTDVDIIFMSDPPLKSTAEVMASSYFPKVPPRNTVKITDCNHWLELFGNGGAGLNAGVMYLNPSVLLWTLDQFMEICRNPQLSNAPVESVYHFYMIEAMDYTLNYFAYWNDSWAGCEVNTLAKPIILHFHAIKPNMDTHPPEVRPYITKEYYINRDIWLSYRDGAAQCNEWLQIHKKIKQQRLHCWYN